MGRKKKKKKSKILKSKKVDKKHSTLQINRSKKMD